MIGRLAALATLVLAAVAAPAGAVPSQLPPVVRAATVDEHVGDRLPLDARFVTADGVAVTLGEVVRGDRPVLLVLGYARCTMLCSVVLRGVAEGVRAMNAEPGRDFTLLMISLDARETVDEAGARQLGLVADLGRTGETWRWPYLIGSRAEIDRVADALGFGYAWDERSGQYAHPAVVFVLTPDGRIAQYVHGVRFAAGQLDAGVRSAAAGRLTTARAAEVLRCFLFDPAARAYRASLQLYFRIGSAVIFALLASAVAALVIWERRRQR